MSTKFRQARWLEKNGFAPQVYLFRNIESGQVIYSQLPHINNYQITQQFWRPNWENKKPTKRRDIWRVMCVADFGNFDASLKAYNALVELKYMRQVTKKKEAEAMRKRNRDGNIWYRGQYRPSYTQESAADLATVIDEFKFPTKLYWETIWRKGSDEHWNLDLAQHDELSSVNPRERFLILDELKKKSREEFNRLKSVQNQKGEEVTNV